MTASPTMDTIGHIITHGGLPCTLYNAARNQRGGVLLPVTGEDDAPVVLFTTFRDARRAIKRTERVAQNLRGSLVDGWVQLAPLNSGQPYKIVPVTRSHAGKPVAKEEGLREH